MSKSFKNKRTRAHKTQNGRCCYCDFPMWLEDPDEINRTSHKSHKALNPLRCTAEHLHARSDGGSNASANIAAACLHCNKTRHRFKRPPEPPRYREIVQKRMRAGKWHDSQIWELVRAWRNSGYKPPFGQTC